MSNWTSLTSAHLTTATATTSTATAPSSARSSPRPGNEDTRIATTRLGPTVSLDARPIVVPMLSCVFGFPVLALAIICALRYRARRARRRSQMKRLQAASATWRHQEEQLRATYSVSDVNERETSLTIPPRDPTGLTLELPPHDGRTSLTRAGRPGSGRKGTAAGVAEQNGRLLRVPKPRCDLDILAERSEVDFEYTEMDVI